MHYDSFFNHALDDIYRPASLVSAVVLCFLFFSFPALAANNYIYDHNTKRWVPTSSVIATPSGTGNTVRAIPPNTTVWGGGGYSSTGGINSKFPNVGKNVPVTVNGRVSPTAVKSGVKSLLKGGVGGLVLGAGIEAMLSGVGALINQGGQVAWVNDPPPTTQPDGTISVRASTCNGCTLLPENYYFKPAEPVSDNFYYYCGRKYAPIAPYFAGFSVSPNMCFYSASDDLPKTPMLPSDIDQLVDGSFVPTVSDYPALAPYLEPDSTFVDPIPTFNEPTTTTTTVDLDTGVTTTVTTNIWHDFDITNNSTSKPSVSVDTTTKTDTYVDGEQTSSSTSTSKTEADPAASTGSSSSPAPEIPTDCDLFPTACAWMEWTKEEPTEPEDNLSDLLQEVPIVSETFTITGGSATCPAPLVLNLSQFGSREVSYQPLCDLASTMKFLYLALMSFAAAVLLNRSINRV